MSTNFENDRRDNPYNNLPPASNIAIWLQFATLIGAMVVSWTTLNTTMTTLNVKQSHIKEDLNGLEIDVKDMKDQVISLERSVTGIYRLKR